ncbi:MAG TPA: hypothetical protein VN680_14045 [Burkholderiaceae bacterium]|jgi:hypothetical protein|nr:hypothetical protein [Burkholderiaceae bacterium]
MITTELRNPESPFHPATQPQGRPRTAPSSHASAFRRIEDRELLQMREVYARHGGLWSGDDIARAMRHRATQPLSVIAKWIVEREVVHLSRHSFILLPMFQFDPMELKLRPGVREVLLELRDALDDWELCAWFAQPSTWLDGAAPVDRLASHAQAVVQAARADRFVALG